MPYQQPLLNLIENLPIGEERYRERESRLVLRSNQKFVRVDFMRRCSLVFLFLLPVSFSLLHQPSDFHSQPPQLSTAPNPYYEGDFTRSSSFHYNLFSHTLLCNCLPPKATIRILAHLIETPSNTPTW